MSFHLEHTHAALVALAAASLAVVFVIGWGLLRFPAQWAATKRLKPLEEYMARAVSALGTAHEDLVMALTEPADENHPDWPSRVGPIDMAVHDLPHASCQTEWWYVNAHVTGVEKGAGARSAKRDLSFFASFFRVVKHVDEQGRKYYGHAITWAIIDPTDKEYHFDVALERDAPNTIFKAMEKSTRAGPSDPLLRKALLDVLKKGNVPLPDRLFTSDPVVSNKALHLDYSGSTFTKDSQGRYHVHCATADFASTLVFTPTKAAVRHGDNGVVKGHSGNADDMFYWFVPRLSVTGEMRLPIVDVDSPEPSVRHGAGLKRRMATYSVSGQGWLDREAGGVVVAKPPSREHEEQQQQQQPEGAKTQDYAWNWIAAQLSDGSEVTAAVLIEPLAKKVLEVKCVVVAADGARAQFDGVKDGVVFAEVKDAAPWMSVRTFRKYPTRFRLTVPTIGLDLQIAASFEDQELVTILARPAFYEGRCDIQGVARAGSAPVTGLGFLERNGFDPEATINTFFKNVGVAVRDSVQAMYPLVPTPEQALELVATKDTAHYLDGVPLDILGNTLIAPVRLIADRGGKSWRSYAALACIDAVGGDSRQFVQWVAMPEFLHVGSLIVDDIQDVSETRRGGPCAHKVFGEALSINAGTAAYFQTAEMLKVKGMSDHDLVRCYGLYFAALRGGHAGQALDIYGNDYMMDSVVESGDSTLLEQRIIAIHRLKTAVPAGTLARLGAVVGGATDAQVDAVGRYFEGVGVSFQIMDDVLNLRGIYAKEADKLKAGTALKTLGEDIRCGKVTFPIAKYMGSVKDRALRQQMWDTVKAKPQDQAVVDACIAELERVGAIEACVVESERLVDEAWRRLDSVIPDSFAKLMLRSFGWYVTSSA